MSRFLIWGMMYGPRGLRLAPIWLNAIRAVGKWDHDIVLLGDEGVTDFCAPSLTTVDMLSEPMNLCPQPRSKWTKSTCNNFKSQICRHVDITTYEYVLYLDLDVLVNTDRLEAVVRSKSERGMVAVQEDCIPLPNGRFRALHSMGMPDEQEKFEWAKRPICAGMMGFPMNTTGLSIFHDYHAACLESSFKWSDQAKLVALLNRKYIGAWEFLGDTTFGRRTSPPYSETFIHFTGDRDALLQEYYSLNLQ